MSVASENTRPTVSSSVAVRGYLEKSPIAVLKLTTPGLLYFNVTTWSYSLPVKLLNVPCNGNCRVVMIVSDYHT
jgi:hypothetical protein